MDFFNRRKNTIGLFFCLVVIVIIWSCDGILNTDDYDIKRIEVSPSLAIPLAFGDLSIDDILSQQDSQYVRVASDGLVYLNYDQTLKSQAIRDLITIPDKNNVTASLTVPAATYPPAPNDVNSTQFTQFVFFNMAPEDLTEILLKAGTLNCNITMSPANPNFLYAVNVSIPEFTSAGTGAPFSINAAGGAAGQSFPLANYLFTTPTANRITVKCTLIIKKNPNTVTIPPGTVVTANISFTNMDYKYAKGFFGDQIADLPAETLTIQAFGTSLVSAANISFAQPKIEFRVVNDVGVPTNVYFSLLEARKPGSPPLPIQISPASPVGILPPTTMGDSTTKLVAVTNASALLNYAPTEFHYKTTARINEGLVSGANFITDTSALRVHLHVEIPLYGHASNIKLTDTLDIDLSDADRSEIVDASLKIKTNNQIPLSANMQFYLTDDNYKILDSLLLPDQTNLIKSSQVNPAGELLSEGAVDTKIPLSKDKLEKIFHASKLIIKARMNTTRDANGNYPDVKFKAAYKMGIKLGLQVNGKIKVSL